MTSNQVRQMYRTGRLNEAASACRSVLLSPPQIGSEWELKERSLLQERSSIVGNNYHARKQRRGLTASLEQLWENMTDSPEWTSYGTLRLGMPLSWQHWQAALQQESLRPEAKGRRVTSVHMVWPRSEQAPIQLLASSSHWEQPRSASINVPAHRVAAFAEQCFGSRRRSSIAKWLKMAGGDDGTCQGESALPSSKPREA